MAIRRRANKRTDRKYFSKTAAHVNKRDVNTNPMRGGFRM